MTSAAIAPVDLVDGRVLERRGDPHIRAWFLDAYRHGVPPVTSLSMEAQQPAVLHAWAAWWWTVFHGGVADSRLKERLRVGIAEVSGCLYCATSSMPDPSASTVDPDRSTGRGHDGALAFGRTLATQPWRLGPTDVDAIRTAFPPAVATELLAFTAWQVGGPRVLRSWGADRWKQDGRIDLDRLPVPMAYRREADPGAVVDLPAAPAVPKDEPDAVAWGTRRGAPVAWLRMLEPRPDLLAAWLELYDATIHGLTLGPRVGELVRRELARLLACPAWVTDGASALSDIDDQAVAILDPGILDAHERAALGYVRAVVLDDAPDAGVRAAIATELSMAQRVELGFAVAVQLGPLLVTRASTPASTALGWS